MAAVWIASLLIPAQFVPPALPVGWANVAAHVIAFASAGALIRHLFGPARQILALGATMFLAGLAELLQPLVGRSDTWPDFFAGAAGASLAFIPGQASSTRKLLLIKAAFLMLSVPVFDSMSPRIAQWDLRRRFPSLDAYGEGFVPSAWRPKEPGTRIGRRTYPGSRRVDLEVRAAREGLPGVELVCDPADWSSFDLLRIEVENPSDTDLPMGLRLDDGLPRPTLDAKCQISFDVPPGRMTQRFSLSELSRVPGSQPLDLGHVHRIVLFTFGRGTGRTFVLGRIALHTE